MPSFDIAVFSDVICPWCYLGKRRLEAALDELGLRAAATVSWLPFELNPDMPQEGMERSAYREAKFGLARSRELDAQMTLTGVQEGIAFAFDRQARTPNTRRAHMLIACASGPDQADALVDQLFAAYFEEGRDIGDPETLAGIAGSVGMDRAAAEAALGDPQVEQIVVELEAQAGRIGLQGVPFFIVDRAWAVSGAQPSKAWVDALEQRLRG
jgi:predicted DsbA family dithiol-disulfide isomerase